MDFSLVTISYLHCLNVKHAIHFFRIALETFNQAETLMSDKQRFNRDEVSKILKRAVELEHDRNSIDDSDGLTLQELQQVSKEVGIDPKYIQQALRELQTPTKSLTSDILGGPFKHHILETAPGILTEEEWEEIVSEIRRIHGGIGKTTKLGNTFEWEQRKQEVGYIQISLSPKKDHTKIQLNSNYRYYASMIYTFASIFGVMFLLILFKETEFSRTTQAILTILGATGILTTARFYLSSWMKKKRMAYDKLINRFREMLSSAHKTEKSPTIAIPDDRDQQLSETDSQINQGNKVKD